MSAGESSKVASNKRIRCPQDTGLDYSDDEDGGVGGGGGGGVGLANDLDHPEDLDFILQPNQAKKPREALSTSPLLQQQQHDDSDSDYDDMIDEFAVPNDMDDYLDDDGEEEDLDDDHSTTSTRTTMSTGSVGSNTPSLLGENLESFCLGEGGCEKGGSKQKALIGGPIVRNTEPPLRRSLFSHVPPSLNFVHHNEVPETPLPTELRKNLRWKLSNITPAVVKKVVTNSGFRLMRKNCTDWGGTWGKHMKSYMFKDSIGESQKINHFPGTFNIGRKDRLWKNYQKLRMKHGKEEFSFLPRTFCLPADTKLLRKVWEKRGVKAKWIVKPPAMARGTGIKVVNKWNQVPKSRPLIVQRYIARPHLINNTKYDLRIYVLMTSLHPLRIYLYDEGLVRFASNKYTRDNESLGDIFMHLTNYSINKNSANYTPNDDAEARQGHKWTLASLWQYFAENGYDQKVVWDRIKDMVIKTIISAEHSMLPLVKTNLCSHYCGYELFGFDILLDADLKPWLIEVNISPSLHSASPLDLDVKSPLATEVFNIARYHVPNKISTKSQKLILQKLNMEDVSSLCLDPRLYTRDLSKADKAKQIRIESTTNPDRSAYLDAILDKLTPDDVRCLIRSEDELAQLTHFSRIFPTQDSHRYFKCFQGPRYYNMLLDAWENKYGDYNRVAGIDRLERLCIDKVHLKIPQVPAVAFSSTSVGTKSHIKSKIDVSVLKAPTGNGMRKQEAAAAAAAASVSSTPSETVISSPTETVTSLPLQSPTTTKVPKKLGFVAKPLNVKPAYGITSSSSPLSRSRSATAVASAAAANSSSPGASSPEPMSLGGDSSVASSGGDTRSPSPSRLLHPDAVEGSGDGRKGSISNAAGDTAMTTTTAQEMRLDNCGNAEENNSSRLLDPAVQNTSSSIDDNRLIGADENMTV